MPIHGDDDLFRRDTKLFSRIVITVVNVLGGLVIGVMQRDLSAGDSLRIYGLLTIGDGLVSQIPALLISTAAGLVVTRVASEDADASLGRDVASQVFGHPRPLLIGAGFLALLGVVPGLPTPIFSNTASASFTDSTPGSGNPAPACKIVLR